MNSSKRLFFGVHWTVDEMARLTPVIRQAVPVEQHASIVMAEKWHLTLCFLGQVRTEDYERLLAAMPTWSLGSKFEMTINHWGAFPSLAHARVLWLGVEHGEDLNRLAENLRACLRDLALPFDAEPYRPHITVKRYKKPENISKLLEHADRPHLRLPVTAVQLFESKAGQYIPAASIGLS